MITLGSKVKDTITDFVGIAESYTVHRNGCIRVSVQPKIDKEGKVPDPTWIDIDDLVLVGKRVKVKLLFEIPNEKDPGGPGRSTPPTLR